jgi:hypothetical protein
MLLGDSSRNTYSQFKALTTSLQMNSNNYGEPTPEDLAIKRQIKRDSVDLTDPRSPTLSPMKVIPMVSLSRNEPVAMVYEACPICCKKINPQILIHKNLRDISEMNNQCVDWANKPCPECQKLCEQGMVLIEIDEKKTTSKANPYRTGRIAVITRNSAHKIFIPEIANRNAVFIPIAVSEQLGVFNKDLMTDE